MHRYFKLILIITAAAAVFSSVTAFAEVRLPQLEGEELFNTAAETVAEGKTLFDIQTLINSGIDLFMGQIRDCAGLLAMLVGIAAMTAAVNVLQTSFGTSGSGEAAFLSCFALISAAAVKCFSTALGCGMEVIDALSDFITKLSPVLMGTLILNGTAASAAAFHPVLSAAVYIAALVCRRCIMPLVCFGAVLSVVNNFSTALQISSFCRLTASAAKWILAMTFTIFTGICAIYGFGTPALDAVSAKAMKFAVGSLVPVVGGFLSETLETVIGGTRLVKNAVGTAGIIVMCAICVVPAMKIAVIGILLKLTAAAVEPITDKRISSLLWDVSQNVTTVFAMVVTVAVLFIICVSIIIGATNI